MGKRFRSGGIGGGVNRRFLNVVIDSYGKDVSAEDIVDDLRSKYRDFGRLSRHVLLLNVRQVLNSRNRRMKEDEEEDNSGDEGGVGTRKKQRRVDEREEKLQRAEQSHLRRRKSDRLMSTSSSDSPSTEFSSPRTRGGVSTSEDAIYCEKVTSQFDLINDTLRDSYAKLNRASVNFMRFTSKAIFKNLQKTEYKTKIEEKSLGVIPPGGILQDFSHRLSLAFLLHSVTVGTVWCSLLFNNAILVRLKISGASEENIRELFSKAYRTAPSVVFIDEIDAIASKRENQQREMERRIVTQLMTCMDESIRYLKANVQNSNEDGSDSRPRHVLVIRATNRPDALDSALRRPGRFDREIPLSAPDEKAREEILSVLTHGLRLEGSFDRKRIARATPGFVGADLAALVNMKRIANARKLELPNDSGS
ncbi:PREDICTED: LOW QUALITY PROTEIN: cell division control protein 48 homolog C [Tarenaya hassleriana]|uniref:LOW QUALITY PROTEIN: cell division control protein 48 homolog C n=1 Tax=Tarenaya hassleriana TaxID=28532 RepID=UPI00053C1D13|nr:PREDICTED: LOW QUALITY PROTEIN: cell division control protein 48 homolog C [Tarenaya hassleriana]